ncbi:dihydropteroate synthase [Blastomonas aquatica]|uniref:dihydropteroate synthase n=1 Tax=Blastomonas aquatica TaxID=1510276 RepID=A0ABQ1JEQ3_9SPHN|nr:dihydropteroate synthase [Blastomonas aquatica]GGB66545.1 dihydropteroate synthase [Blastomonas aquatica]
MSGKVYVRPVGLAESPQTFAGATIRLGSSLVWCHLLAIETYDAGRLTARRIVPVDGFVDALETLPDDQAERARVQFANLSRQHAPLALGERMLRFDQPQVMGILNVTPDSFSDGGRFTDDPASAADAGFAMLTAGASLIDIGGESTRPDAPVVWEGDEIARVVPAISALAHSGAILSVDTRKASVMEAALEAGAHIVNDVSALLFDSRALDVVAQAGCPVVLMHAPSQGQNPHTGPGYGNVVTDVFDWLEARIAAVIAAGVARDRIMIDPGIGFGKCLADNLALINALPLFHALGQPILFGASRKRMIGALSNEAPVDARLGGSLALALSAIGAGAQIVRVHDVPETVQAARVWRGLRDAALTMPGLG